MPRHTYFREHIFCLIPKVKRQKSISVSWVNFFADRPISVLGHGHVFKVWILISSGSDIIIQIGTRGFGVI